MATIMRVTTHTWYIMVPELKPTLAALSIRAQCAVGMQFSLKASFPQILSQLWEHLLLAEPSLNPNTSMMWGMCQQECNLLTHGKFQALGGSLQSEVRASTRTVKGP